MLDAKKLNEGVNLYDEKHVEKEIQAMEDLRLCYCKYGMLWIADFDTDH